MSDLPEGWIECEFGEICQVVGGGTPPSRDSSNFTETGGIAWITPADLSGYDKMYIERGARNLTDKGYRLSSAKLVPPGTVLFSSRAPVGYVAIAASELATSQGFKSYVLPKELDSRYVYYYLRHIKPIAEARATGTTFKELSGKNAAKLPLRFPPLAEQQRIADTLDALLARVDACRARLGRVPALLKRFREAVLAAAVAGRLTEDWREENGIAFPWNIVALPDVAQSRLGKMLDKAKNQGTLTPYLRNINVRWFDFDLTDIQEIRISPAEAESLYVRSGDVLVCEGGEPGRCAVWRGKNNTYVFQKALHRVQVNDKLLPDWLCYCLKAEADSGRLEDLFTNTFAKKGERTSGCVR